MTALKNDHKPDDSKILIFDTNIFLTGIDLNIILDLIYTTPSIIDEIKVNEKNRNIISKIQTSIETKKLILKVPKKRYIDLIEKKSMETGDFNALSKADRELLALTLELTEFSDQEVKLYTNDYSMENVCSKLNIPFSPLYKKGIKSTIIWEIYCPFCKNVYMADELNKFCEECGSKLKRRPKIDFR
jgi:rRNA maturation endonuclease Nob1